MSIIANVKGYFMGGERGVISNTPSLWSYEEIIAASLEDVLAELNSRSSDYYDKLQSETHLYLSMQKYFISSNGSASGLIQWDDEFFIYYLNGVWYQGDIPPAP